MKNYPVIVIGSGISGLYTALKLEQELNTKILLVTKNDLGDSNSYYAQGGMVAVLSSNKNDSVDSHVNDTIKAGAGLCEKNTVEYISKNSDNIIKDLLTFGVHFDRDEQGNFTLTKEAAHSVNRILHSAGDATGREIEISLIESVKKNKNIEIYENTLVVDLIVNNNICSGVITFKNGEYSVLNSNFTILATGGLGQIYKYTTNPHGATGDGFALAYRAKAKLRDMEFVQFHPTALAFDDEKRNNRFLISEAVRGEGAKLCNKKGVYYMEKYDKQKDLAPRDIVARANFLEMKNNNSLNVYLDATFINNEIIFKRFPTIAKKCLEYGIDISKDLIPVAPAAHYFMGGIKTNIYGQTSVKNLYAIGEVASTGLHGANRLASNSLLECVVCAASCAKNICQTLNNSSFYEIKSNALCLYKYINNPQTKNITKNELQILIDELKTTMWENVGIFRSFESLELAKNQVDKIKKDFGNMDICSSSSEYDLRNMIICAELIIKSAINRKESRGAHYRTDYLQTNFDAIHSEI